VTRIKPDNRTHYICLLTSLVFGSIALCQSNISIGSVSQKTGNCSVNVVGVQGSVTINRNCQEIPPAAMKAINKLNAAVRDLREQAAKNQEAIKAYQEIIARLDAQGESPQILQVKSLAAAGKFAEALTVLQPLTTAADKQAGTFADKAAGFHYETAKLYDLTGQPWKALPEYAEAHRLSPGEVTYSQGYAQSLLVEGKNDLSEKVSTQILPSLRQLAASNPTQYQTTLAVTLCILAAADLNQRQFDPARKAVDESLKLLHNAPEGEASVWGNIVVANLVKTAIYVAADDDGYVAAYDDDSYDDEEDAKQTAEDTVNLLLLHSDEKSPNGRLLTAQLQLLDEKKADAEMTLREVMTIVRANQVAKDELNRVLEAATLEFLAAIYEDDDRDSEFRKARSDEVTIYRRLAALNARYRDPLAEALRLLAVSEAEPLTAWIVATSGAELKQKEEERAKSIADPNSALRGARAAALSDYAESARLLTQLSVNEPDRYRRRLIAAIQEIADFCRIAGLGTEALDPYVLQIEKGGLQGGSEFEKILLAKTELAAADFYRSVKDTAHAEKVQGQALDSLRSMAAAGSAAAATVLISELWKIGSGPSRAQDSGFTVRTYTEAWALCQRFAGTAHTLHFETNVQNIFQYASRYYLTKHMDDEYDSLAKGLPQIALNMYTAIPSSYMGFSIEALTDTQNHYRATKRPLERALFLLATADLVLQQASRYHANGMDLWVDTVTLADISLDEFDRDSSSAAFQPEAMRYRAALGDIRKCMSKCDANNIDRLHALRDTYLGSQRAR